METLTTRIIIQDIVVTIVKSMDIEHTLEVTTRGGCVKPHVLAF